MKPCLSHNFRSPLHIRRQYRIIQFLLGSFSRHYHAMLFLMRFQVYHLDNLKSGSFQPVLFLLVNLLRPFRYVDALRLYRYHQTAAFLQEFRGIPDCHIGFLGVGYITEYYIAFLYPLIDLRLAGVSHHSSYVFPLVRKLNQVPKDPLSELDAISESVLSYDITYMGNCRACGCPQIQDYASWLDWHLFQPVDYGSTKLAPPWIPLSKLLCALLFINQLLSINLFF